MTKVCLVSLLFYLSPFDLLMSRRFYSQQSPSPSVTNLIQPISNGASLVRRSSLLFSDPGSPPPVPLRLYQQEPLRRTFYIRQGAPSYKTLRLPADLEFPSSLFHQTPPRGVPTSPPTLWNQTTTSTTLTPGEIQSLTEASTCSLTEASLILVVSSSSVLVSWPYCLYPNYCIRHFCVH